MVSYVFQADCTEKCQSQSFSGVCPHQQNANSEHAILTIMSWHQPTCNMFHFIGLNVVLMIWHYGCLLSSMLDGCTMGYLAQQASKWSENSEMESTCLDRSAPWFLG